MEWICPDRHGPLVRDEGRAHCRTCGARWERVGDVWENSLLAEPERFDPLAAGRLADLGEHFWVRGRRKLFAKILDRLAGEGRSAIDLGCGSGDLLPGLTARFDRVVGVDAWSHLLQRASEKATGVELVKADVGRVPLADGSFDLAATCDVIEHVEPAALLGEARRLVRTGGHLLVSAPAFPCLWSDVDVRAGHRLRYRRAVLDAELRAAGWEPIGSTHFQFLAFPAVWFSRRLGLGGPGGMERRPPRWMSELIAATNSVETSLLARFELPFGSSLIAWARAV